MILTLLVMGGICILVSLILGFISGSFLGFIVSVFNGITGGLIFFALSHILDTQAEILDRLKKVNDLPQVIETKSCNRCEYVYPTSCSSCPHCGHKD